MTKENVAIELAKLTAQLQTGAIKPDKFNQEVAALVARASAAPAGLSIKSGEKGTLVVRGEGFIVGQLYASQWEALLTDENIGQIREFISANRATLAKRPAKKAKEDKKAAPIAPAPAAQVVALPPGIDAAALAAFIAAGAAQAK